MLSDASYSPRFYGQGQPPYFGKPDEVSKDLITNLEKGMYHLRSTIKKENVEPSVRQHYGLQASQQQFYQPQRIFTSQDDLRSTDTYDLNRLQHFKEEMSLEDLENLKQQNLDRIKDIESKYFQKKEEIRKTKEILQEKADIRETKEKHVDSSLNYPTYGRGMDPNINFDSFMINKNLCHEGNSPQKKRQVQGIEMEFQSQTKRPKVISPRRQKFENQFEKFIVHKYVEEKVKEPPVEESNKANEKFDCVTKLTGSLNVKIIEKQKKEEERIKKAKEAKILKKNRSLYALEANVEKLLTEEALVLLTQEFLDRLRTVFESCKEDPDSSQDTIDFNTLIGTIVEDEYFQEKMNQIVRETIDGEKEKFEDLLNRVCNDYREQDISWVQFLGFFSKRGRLQGFNDINVSPSKKNVHTDSKGSLNAEQGGEKEIIVYKLQKQVKEKLNYKQKMIPKKGKGKYNLTVPVPYEFQQKEKTKTIREKKLEEMLIEKEQKETQFVGYQFKANDIPRTTKEPLFQKITENNEKRRLEVKRLSMAITKEREKPFSFYEREKLKPKQIESEIPECMQNPPFRANKIPWKVLVPLYKRMVDKIEYEREIRIKKNAELSLSMAKLPPRMEEYEKKRKMVSMQEEVGRQRSQSVDAMFTFQPPRAKPVPDFKRLQKQFQASLECKRQSHKTTIPNPFTFHQPKSTANMRQYLDIENQKINPTVDKLNKSLSKSRSKIGGVRSNSPGERDVKENPAMTLKFDAYVQKKRHDMESRKMKEENKFQEEVQRFIKQNRLSQRVKCSPAIVNNAIELQKRKAMSIKRAKSEMKKKEQQWEDQKQAIEFNVANRPLLVEQVSKAFIRNLNQIRELQRYVNILREANLNPDEHLTEEQKELLLSAEYYDRLNAATAYFPSTMGVPGQNQYQEYQEGEYDMDEGEDDGEDQQNEGIGSEPIEENQNEEDEDDEDEGQMDDEEDQEGNGQQPLQQLQHDDDNDEGDEEDGQQHDIEEQDVNEDDDEGEDNGEDDDDGEEMIEMDEDQIRQFLLYQQQQQMLMAQEEDDGEEGEMEDDVYGEEMDQE